MVNVVELIKKMLVRRLNASERILLSEEKPMKELLSRQWEEDSDRHIQDKVDAELIWNNITAACWGNNGKKRLKPTKKIRMIRLAYATAAVVALLLIGTWTAYLMTDSYITVTAPMDRKLSLLLPDSSNIWVNAGGTVRYKKEFRKDRRVMLDGEAYFDVVKIPTSPFRVLFNGACIEVKGTTFTIKAEQQKAEIILFSGKVAFTAPESKTTFEMQPSDRILYDAVTRNVSFMHVDAAEYDWRSTEYRFVDKPLGELIDFLNRTYQVQIIVKNEGYEKSLFSGTIRKDEPLEDVLDKVCFTFNLQLRQTDTTITLF